MQASLDGHSNGAEQIVVAARASGIEVVYDRIRLTPARIAIAALEEGVHIVDLSILSGSHMPLVKEVLRKMREFGVGEVPVVVGGIIPPEDAKEPRPGKGASTIGLRVSLAGAQSRRDISKLLGGQRCEHRGDAVAAIVDRLDVVVAEAVQRVSFLRDGSEMIEGVRGGDLEVGRDELELDGAFAVTGALFDLFE